jgi:hypothetical protein
VGSSPSRRFAKSADFLSRSASQAAPATTTTVSLSLSLSRPARARHVRRRTACWAFGVWPDPGAGQAAFFCPKSKALSKARGALGLGQTRANGAIRKNFFLPVPRGGPAGPGTQCGVRVRCAGARGVRSSHARVWRAAGLGATPLHWRTTSWGRKETAKQGVPGLGAVVCQCPVAPLLAEAQNPCSARPPPSPPQGASHSRSGPLPPPLPTWSFVEGLVSPLLCSVGLYARCHWRCPPYLARR